MVIRIVSIIEIIDRREDFTRYKFPPLDGATYSRCNSPSSRISHRIIFIMKRIRNLDLNKVEAEVETEADGDKIKSRTEQVAGKLRAVQEELSSLMEQLESTRDSSRKT